MKKIITKIIAFISFVLIAMETFNKIILYMAKKNYKVMPIVNKTYNWRFGDIRYMVKGNGDALLLIHDMSPGSSSLEWKKIIDQLADKYCVYALDLPGFGISDKKIKTYTNFLYVSAICDFISDIIKEKTTVVTSKEAASIAVLSAYQRKDLFNKIIFVNPESAKIFNQAPDENSKKIKKLFALPIIGTFLYLINVHKNNNVDYLFAAQYDGENARYYYGSYVGNYVNFPIHHRIGELAIPMLLITGEKVDNISNITSEYYSYVDNSITIENASQFPHLEKPEAFCKAFDTLLQYNNEDR